MGEASSSSASSSAISKSAESARAEREERDAAFGWTGLSGSNAGLAMSPTSGPGVDGVGSLGFQRVPLPRGRNIGPCAPAARP